MISRHVVRIALIAAVAALALAPTALAGTGGGGGKPPGGGRAGGGGSSSFSLVLMDGATQAAHNGRITFNVSTTATDRPFVGLRCWQGTNFVYDGYVGYFPGRHVRSLVHARLTIAGPTAPRRVAPPGSSTTTDAATRTC